MSENGGNMGTRRILLVSYWYPRAIGAAAERVFGFAQHLPANGWEVQVLTAARPGSVPETPGVTVHSVTDPSARVEPFEDFDPRRRPSFWKKLGRQLVFPDRFWRWRKQAARCGRGLMESRRFDAVLASFPPASAVQVGLALVGGNSIPFALDFRDRWFGPGGYEPIGSTFRRLHQRLQQKAVARATLILTVSDAMKEALLKEFNLREDRVVVLPNGYEIIPRPEEEIAATMDAASSETEAATTGLKPGSLTIAHVGTVIPRNRPELFFDGLQKVRSDPRLEGVEFRFVGNLSRDYVREMGLQGLATTTGLLDRASATREMRKADALLLLTGAYVGQWGTSAKLFEYLQTGRPVLCLEECPGSNDRKLLEQFVPERAFFARLGDDDGLLEQVERIRQYVAMHPQPAIVLDPAFRDYSRASLTGKLAQSLDRLVADK
ncbi:MAG TPA: glycosyltransferase [Phycisphaerae bacterium]|nr:glycosyltransferase [Phycisphaerae bacterium]